MLFCFFRQVIPDLKQGKDGARVKAHLGGIVDGKRVEIGDLEFPDKPSWTKFYGAISKGALGISELEVRMENVPWEGVEIGLEPGAGPTAGVNQPTQSAGGFTPTNQPAKPQEAK